MLSEYLSSLNPMRAAKARAALEMFVKHNGGGIYRRHILIESKMASGARITTRKNGERVLMNPDGSWLDTMNITKTGLDYAEYIEGTTVKI